MIGITSSGVDNKQFIIQVNETARSKAISVVRLCDFWCNAYNNSREAFAEERATTKMMNVQTRNPCAPKNNIGIEQIVTAVNKITSFRAFRELIN